MAGIIFLVSLSLLLNLKRKKLEKKGDSSHLIDFIALDATACYIYCVALCLFSVLAEDLIETHRIPEPLTHSPVIWCPAPGEPPPGAWESLSSKTTHSHFGQHLLRECHKFLPKFLNGPSVIRDVHSSFWASVSSRGKLSSYLPPL